VTVIEVTDQLVHHVARLSRLAISEDEAAALGDHFRKILAYVAEFQALDTSDVDPSHFALEAENVYRQDEPGPSLPVGDVLRNAPQANPPYFVVPRIVGDPAAQEPEGGGGP
jgi:aspartyl-tRNA(Asn)/glutamyl-tRNA(Gln) amidotransferase subunit C